MDTDLDLVRVPAGDVRLRDARNETVRDVALDAFWLSSSAVALPGTDRPASSVTWLDAVRLCNRFSDEAGFARAYVIDGRRVEWDVTADGFRLPTEAEWEYACRAGTSSAQYGDLREIAWTSLDPIDGVQAPRSKRPNDFGLYDTLGNVWEWCWDYLDPARYGDYRVFRGGSWADPPWSVRASVRRGSAPDAVVEGTGFRVARGVASSAVPGLAQGWSAARDRERAEISGPLPIGWTPLRAPASEA